MKNKIANWRIAANRNFVPYSSDPSGFWLYYSSAQYAAGWWYGPEAYVPSASGLNSPHAWIRNFAKRPTLSQYIKRRNILLADCNSVGSPRYTAPFHQNGKYQNFIRPDGQADTLKNYWNTLGKYTPYDYWHTFVGAPYYFWWSCFAE